MINGVDDEGGEKQQSIPITSTSTPKKRKAENVIFESFQPKRNKVDQSSSTTTSTTTTISSTNIVDFANSNLIEKNNRDKNNDKNNDQNNNKKDEQGEKDWSVKTYIRVDSQFDFDWFPPFFLNDNSKITKQHHIKSQSQQQQPQSQPQTLSTPIDSKNKEFLNYFVHSISSFGPPEFLRKAYVNWANTKDNNHNHSQTTEDAVYFGKKLQLWKRSFSSLYSLFKSGKCFYFYVHCVQFDFLFRHTKQNNDSNNTVAAERLKSLAVGVSSDCVVEALSGGCAPAILAALRKNQIKFETSEPLSKKQQHATVTESEIESPALKSDEIKDQLKFLQSQGKSSSSSSRMMASNSSPSIYSHELQSIRVVNFDQLDFLFNFILNFDGYQHNLPELLSTTCFLESEMKELEIVANSKVSHAEGTSILHSHRFEIQGIILPTMLDSIVEKLKSMQGGDFRAHLGTMNGTQRFASSSKPITSIQQIGFHPLRYDDKI